MVSESTLFLLRDLINSMLAALNPDTYLLFCLFVALAAAIWTQNHDSK